MQVTSTRRTHCWLHSLTAGVVRCRRLTPAGYRNSRPARPLGRWTLSKSRTRPGASTAGARSADSSITGCCPGAPSKLAVGETVILRTSPPHPY